MTWWDPFGDLSVATINGNLVVPYWIPGDEKHSGLSLIGTNKVDESLCVIFDYLRDKGDEPRLVNVPQFVISSVRYPEMFTFRGDRARDEYIVDATQFYPLKNMAGHRRRKVERSLSKWGEENIVVKSLDLGIPEHRDMLLDAAKRWQTKNINNYGKLEEDSIRTSIMDAEELGIENVCLFVDGQLHGFCLYAVPTDKRYITLNCIKATHESTLGFELMAYMFARWFVDRGVSYANLNADYGLMRLRMFMLTLGPVNFFRKFTIQPA
jgi:hypothetical protein